MKHLCWVPIDKAISAAHTAVELLNEFELGDKGDGAGYLTILDCITGRIMLVIEIGICPNDDTERLFERSVEAARRLYQNRDHLRSWSSCYEKNKFGGGAIRISTSVPFILSFAGTVRDFLAEPALTNEAVVILMAVMLGWLNKDSDLVLEASRPGPGQNQYIDPLFLRLSVEVGGF